MPCEYCPNDGDESECSMCRDDDHRDRQLSYSRLVSLTAMAVLVAVCVAAAVCGLVNKLTH